MVDRSDPGASTTDASTTDAATPDDGMRGGWVPLLERAERIGQLVWVERQLFERYGAWAGATGVDVVDVGYGESSRRHGWHAQVFFERLPELSVLHAETLVIAPGPATAALFEHLAELDDVPAEQRWWITHRVVQPLLVATLRAERASVDPTAEPALDRWLRIVLADDVDELLHGDAVARQLLPPDADPDELLVAQLHAERLAHASSLLRR